MYTSNGKKPRIFNGETNQQQLSHQEERARRRQKEVHRVRKNWLFLIFGVVILVLTFQIVTTKFRTDNISHQVNASKTELVKLNHQHAKLADEASNLNDPQYVGKLIRYKYYYSKPGETIYNLPKNHLTDSKQND